jgi:hypothetical protein
VAPRPWLIEGPEIDQVPYPVKLILTAAGRRIVTDQDGWVQPEAAPPTGGGSKPPVNAIGQVFLRWLYDNDRLQPMPQKFLDEPRSVIEGYTVDEAEMAEAVRLLVAKGLVKGPTSWQSRGIPLRIRLTDAGRICVVDHDGNLGQQATWTDREQDGGTTVDETITTTGNGNTVVGHSKNVNVITNPARAPEFTIEHTGAVESGHEIELTMIGRPQQLHVGIGAAVLDPQEGVTASLRSGETRRMVRDFKRKLVVAINPPVNDADVVIEIIATCQDVEPPNERWALHRALTITGPPRIH